MKVSIVLNRANKSWIIEKIATRLADELIRMNVTPVIAETVDASADIVHHMSWAFANTKSVQPSTMFITHLDDNHKLGQVCSTLQSGTVNVGICMSSDTRQQLLDAKAKAEQVTFISPAHDALLKPRPIVLGFTTRLYPDGRKREQLLLDVASRMSLESFEFRIFGSGWDRITPMLEKAGARVVLHQETSDYQHDYQAMIAAIPLFDYYVYLGLDEGSLGTLDALAAGVKTIITPQGFHLDLPGGITHPVLTADDLEHVFKQILADRNALLNAAAPLTWQAYAENHVKLWSAMLSRQPIPVPEQVAAHVSSQLVEDMRRLRLQNLRQNSISFRRILSRISHLRILRPLRRAIDRLRLKR